MAGSPDSQRVGARGVRPDAAVLVRSPTPVFKAEDLGFEHGELWIKNDGVINEAYGGNKVRKLELILEQAMRRGARRLVTMGAAGSHHVLASSIFAKQCGLVASAVLCPQPWSEHAEQTLRAALASGLDAHPVASALRIPLRVAGLLRSGDLLVPVGGSSIAGVVGYVRAVTELVDQIRSEQLPEPDVIVAALGSGGTVAGLLAGVLREGLRCRVLGISVAARRAAARALVLPLAWAGARRQHRSAEPLRLARTLLVDDRQLGRGYGHPTQSGAAATEVAREIGLTLDPTYTAKAFAGVLSLLGARDLADPSSDQPQPIEIIELRARNQPLRVLYWHTLSAAPLEPLLQAAPAGSELPPGLRELFHTS